MIGVCSSSLDNTRARSRVAISRLHAAEPAVDGTGYSFSGMAAPLSTGFDRDAAIAFLLSRASSENHLIQTSPLDGGHMISTRAQVEFQTNWRQLYSAATSMSIPRVTSTPRDGSISIRIRIDALNDRLTWRTLEREVYCNSFRSERARVSESAVSFSCSVLAHGCIANRQIEFRIISSEAVLRT